MKRCPQCLFLYPEADERCDFDQTTLEVVDDAEIDAATKPSKTRRPRRRVLPVAAAVALLLGIVAFAIYYGLSRRTRTTATVAQPVIAVESATPSPPVVTIPSPSPVPSPSPSPSASPTPKTAATVTTSHSRASTDPVSTSGPGIGTRQGGKPVILLTSGGKIEADEVWRTRDGVWYRRNGMVTLLKRSQVKSISTR